jgi:hypothetical protein
MSVGRARTTPQQVAPNHTSPKVNDNTVEYRVAKVKQNLPQPCESLYADFGSWDKIGSFDIQYRVNGDMVDVKGRLRVEIQKK